VLTSPSSSARCRERAQHAPSATRTDRVARPIVALARGGGEIVPSVNDGEAEQQNERESSAERRGAQAREDYAYALAIPTRWIDTDAHGHVNNAQYYSFFDTVVTMWLIAEARHDVRSADVIGVCIESQCTFHAALSFPETVDARMRVGHIGRTSVR
jgi:Thioesterase superfamily